MGAYTKPAIRTSYLRERFTDVVVSLEIEGGREDASRIIRRLGEDLELDMCEEEIYLRLAPFRSEDDLASTPGSA